MRATIVRYDPRNSRFDITFEIANDVTYSPTKLRFTGTAVETVEAAVLTRSVERNDILKSSDVIVERRPKAEVGNDIAIRDPRDRPAGAQAIASGTGAQGGRSRKARYWSRAISRDADL